MLGYNTSFFHGGVILFAPVTHCFASQGIEVSSHYRILIRRPITDIRQSPDRSGICVSDSKYISYVLLFFNHDHLLKLLLHVIWSLSCGEALYVYTCEHKIQGLDT